VRLPSSREIASSRAVQQTVGTVGAWYLRFVWATSTQVLEPADIYERVQTPAIIAMWHGQHFLMPFIKKANAEHRAKVLISRHRDGEVNAIAAEKLGIGTIGVIKLAQHSQRPIHGVAIASSRRKELNNWDRTAINLPFSRIALVASEAITVDANADAAMLEAKRLEVQNELNRLTRRAYEIADRGSRAP
jgi:lysophospholipid acyltransferase (LPLAT)-like uncharacterized protein